MDDPADIVREFSSAWNGCLAWADELALSHRDAAPPEWDGLETHEQRALLMVVLVVATAVAETAHARGLDAPNGARLGEVPLEAAAAWVRGPEQVLVTAQRWIDPDYAPALEVVRDLDRLWTSTSAGERAFAERMARLGARVLEDHALAARRPARVPHEPVLADRLEVVARRARARAFARLAQVCGEDE